MDNKKLIEFAVKGLIISENKFLAVHHAKAILEGFELPGGRMIFGETAEATVIREIKEETGLVAKPVKLVDTWNFIVNDTWQITGVIYLCTCEDVTEITLSEEHDGYEWLEFNQASFSRMNSLFRPKMEKWIWDDLSKNW